MPCRAATLACHVTHRVNSGAAFEQGDFLVPNLLQRRSTQPTGLVEIECSTALKSLI